jgi:hypothetical protein
MTFEYLDTINEDITGNGIYRRDDVDRAEDNRDYVTSKDLVRTFPLSRKEPNTRRFDTTGDFPIELRSLSGDDVRIDNLELMIMSAKQKLLLLEDNWDGEGSKKIDTDAFARAEELLNMLSETFLEKYQMPIKIPDIIPGTNGEVEIRWETEFFTLSIDIYGDQRNAVYFGMDSRGNRIKGTISAEMAYQIYIHCVEMFG